MRMGKASFLLGMLTVLLAGYAFSDSAVDKEEQLDDPAYQYNCELSILDAATKEIVGHQILRNGYDEESVTPAPPGNASSLLVVENPNAGIVEAYDMYMPARTIKNLFKKLPEQATVKIYRRSGAVQDDGEMGNEIPRIESDTLLGQMTIKGTASQTVPMDKYLVSLNCIQNPDKR